MSAGAAMPDAAFKAVIVVFARMPVPGKAKTRLAASVGPEAAAEFYKLCAEQTFFAAHSCPSADAMVFCSAAAELLDMQLWLQGNNTPMPVHAQHTTPNLGRRMLAALSAAAAVRSSACESGTTASDNSCCSGDSRQLQEAETQLTGTSFLQQQQQQQQQQEGLVTAQCQAQQYSAVLVIGTDIPDLTAEELDQAVTALGTYDMVLGPAMDGGFYLMGFATPALLHPEVQSGRVFESVEWSTETVLQRTVAAAQKIGLNLAPMDTLPILQDVDTLQDLQAWHRAVTVARESGVQDHHHLQQHYHQHHHQQRPDRYEQSCTAVAFTGSSRCCSTVDTHMEEPPAKGLQQKRSQLMANVRSLLQQHPTSGCIVR